MPLEVHTHATSGIAGTDIPEKPLKPVLTSSIQPSLRLLAAQANRLLNWSQSRWKGGYNTQLDMTKLGRNCRSLCTDPDRFRNEGILNPKVKDVEPKTLLYQVPGGMLSNLLSQLTEQGLQDKYDDVLAEVPKVRADLGYPPLVTPLSQMVGTQALMNVISGERYKLVPNEIKEYVRVNTANCQ